MRLRHATVIFCALLALATAVVVLTAPSRLAGSELASANPGIHVASGPIVDILPTPLPSRTLASDISTLASDTAPIANTTFAAFEPVTSAMQGVGAVELETAQNQQPADDTAVPQCTTEQEMAPGWLRTSVRCFHRQVSSDGGFTSSSVTVATSSSVTSSSQSSGIR